MPRHTTWGWDQEEWIRNIHRCRRWQERKLQGGGGGGGRRHGGLDEVLYTFSYCSKHNIATADPVMMKSLVVLCPSIPAAAPVCKAPTFVCGGWKLFLRNCFVFIFIFSSSSYHCAVQFSILMPNSPFYSLLSRCTSDDDGDIGQSGETGPARRSTSEQQQQRAVGKSSRSTICLSNSSSGE